MSIFFASYSLALSLLLILVLAHLIASSALRLTALIISFASLSLSLYILNITATNFGALNIPVYLNFLSIKNINIGLYITKFNALLYCASTLSFLILLFFISSKKLNSNLILLCLTFIMLAIPSNFSNIIIGFALFSITEIFVTYYAILKNDKRSFAHLSDDFIWQRASDIAAFMSFLLILNNQENIISYKIITHTSEQFYYSSLLLFLAILIRIFILPGYHKYMLHNHDTNFNYFCLSKIYMSLGALLFLDKINNAIFLSKYNNFYLITIIFLMLHSIFIFFKYNKPAFLPINISYLFIITALIAYYFRINLIAEIIILSLIILTPILIFLCSAAGYVLKQKPESKLMQDPIVLIERLSKVLADFSARASARFASIFYANFLFYRLPQLLISFLQFPLRIFHTGSLQRSVLFILVLSATYYWLWG